MKKIFVSLAVLTASLLTACSSVPEGSKEPVATIESVTLAQGHEPGFNIDFSVFHRSLEPLPFKSLDISVAINTKDVAQYHEILDDTFINPNVKNSFKRFVKINKAEVAQSTSLENTPMLKVLSNVNLKITVVNNDDLKSFNPEASFEGIITHDN